MKKKVEVEIDLPEYLDDKFIMMLSLLNEREFSFITGIIQGFLLGRGVSFDGFEFRNKD